MSNLKFWLQFKIPSTLKIFPLHVFASALPSTRIIFYFPVHSFFPLPQVAIINKTLLYSFLFYIMSRSDRLSLQRKKIPIVTSFFFPKIRSFFFSLITSFSSNLSFLYLTPLFGSNIRHAWFLQQTLLSTPNLSQIYFANRLLFSIL